MKKGWKIKWPKFLANIFEEKEVKPWARTLPKKVFVLFVFERRNMHVQRSSSKAAPERTLMYPLPYVLYIGVSCVSIRGESRLTVANEPHGKCRKLEKNYLIQ